MRATKPLLIAILCAAAGLGSTAVLAHDHWHGHGGDHVHFGVVIGGPGFWYPPPYYYYPRYYYPPVVTVPVPTSPPTYIEQDPAPEQDDGNYWYYCPDSKTYYPYVKQCASSWQRVTPQPPPAR